MTSKRKFYKTVFSYEILSEDPIESFSLDDINYETQEVRWSGQFLETKQETLDGKEAAKALENQSSDPEFFNLTPEGNDLEEDT